MSTAALATPYLDGPATHPVCHLAQADRILCGAHTDGPTSCHTPGVRFIVCPDCGLDVCSRCRELALLWCALATETEGR